MKLFSIPNPTIPSSKFLGVFVGQTYVHTTNINSNLALYVVFFSATVLFTKVINVFTTPQAKFTYLVMLSLRKLPFPFKMGLQYTMNQPNQLPLFRAYLIYITVVGTLDELILSAYLNYYLKIQLCILKWCQESRLLLAVRNINLFIFLDFLQNSVENILFAIVSLEWALQTKSDKKFACHPLLKQDLDRKFARLLFNLYLAWARFSNPVLFCFKIFFILLVFK